MTSQWLPHTILRAASLLAPHDRRAEWLKGWRSELWYIPRRGATRFCLGAFPDALWVRRHNPASGRTGIRLESPLSCLSCLAALATVSSLLAILLPAPENLTRHPHLAIHDIPAGCAAMLPLSVLILLAAWLVTECTPARRAPAPWPMKLWRLVFFALKVALLQPAILCGFTVMVWIGPMLALATQLAIFTFWFLTLRWVLLDQRNRCPVCLRLLSQPVRIGAPSQTFLEWYGCHSMCSRGHGMLQISETPASYAERAEWHRLDSSWTPLFSDAVEVRLP